MIRRACLISATSCMVSLAACGDKRDPIDGAPCVNVPPEVTYSVHIKPILDDHCVDCHAAVPARGDAPREVNFDNYKDAAFDADEAVAQVQAGLMPPRSDHNPVNATDLCLMRAWAHTGAKP
jgi:uncharacterized membrane protein